MLSHAYGIPSGYEPNLGRSASRYAGTPRPPRREKVGDDLIKVLPDFGYDVVRRKTFELALIRMIRSINGGWMLMNVLRPTANPGAQFVHPGAAMLASCHPGKRGPAPS